LRLRAISIAVAAGVALGTFCAFANYSQVTSTLGQMVTPWIVTAALVGLASPTLSVSGLAGGTALLIANLVYYGWAAATTGVETPRYLTVWALSGIVVGPLSGITGWVSHNGSDRWRIVAAAGLAAVVWAESFVLWGHIDHLDAHVTYMVASVLALVLQLVILRDMGRRRWLAPALSLLLAIPLALLFEDVFGRLGIVTPR
jgi:hypothetical protein